MRSITCKNRRVGGNSLSYLLSMIVMLGVVSKVSAEEEVVDLKGQSVSSADFGAYRNKIITNGELTLTKSPSEATAGKYTIGSDAVVKYAGGPGFSGDWDFNIIDGGVFEQTKESDGRFLIPFYYGKASFILNNGTFKSVDDSRSNNAETLSFGVIWINNNGAKDKDISANVKIQNKSKIELTRGQLRIGGARAAGDKKPKTLKVDFAVEDSSIYVAKEIKFGVSNSGWLQNAGESYVKATFGKNSDITCKQFYADGNNPSPSVTFDGATFHWLEGGNSFIGHNKVGDIYTIAKGGLTVDIPKGKALTCDSNASSLKGEGGITKIGEGSITWNQVSSQGSPGMTFTGPLVVSNGTWTSTLGYAASAFKVDGKNSKLTLSGELSAQEIDFEATEGGILTLAGATISDEKPNLTIDSGGRTDYFTRDNAVKSYSLNSLTLGPGAVLNLDAGNSSIDSIAADNLSITASAEDPLIIRIAFSAAPSTGEKFNLFNNVSSENIKVEAVFAGVVIPVSATVEGDTLVVTVVAEDYTWNSTGTKWSDDGAWTKGGSSVNWSDGNAAIFNGGEVDLDKNVSASELSFIGDSSVNAGETTETAPILTTPKIDVIEGKTATVSAELSAGVEKTGLGTLVLSKSRENKGTTVSDGTLKISGGAAIGTLRLGTDKSKPVTFDYDGQTLNANPTTYLGAGMDVGLINGVYCNGGTITFSNDTFPYTLTVGENSRVEASDRFNFNTSGEATINIDGGILQSDANNNNWIMQASQKGVLKINVKNGGLFEFGGETYMLTCRDGDDKYESPELHISVVDSTVRVKNGKSLRLGCDSNTKTSAKPTLSLAATNSVFDIGYGLYLGNDKEGLSTEGSYTADFQNCVITAFQFCVYSDRPVNKAVLNGTRLAFNREGASLSQQSDDEVARFVIGEEGLTIDTQAYSASLKANLGGNGGLTKVGGGKLTIEKSQTAGGVLNVLEGTVLVAADVTLNKSIKVASGATLELVSLSKDSPIATGSTFIFEQDSKLVLPAISEAGKFRLFALDNGEFSENATENITIEGIDIPHKLVVEGSTIFIELSYEGDTRKGAWTGKANDRDLLNPANWVNGELPTETAFIGVADNVKLVCNDRFDVKSIEFYGDGELEVSGNGSIVVQSISSICSTRPVVNVPVEFKSGDEYVAIDVTGEVDFQGGVTGTVPVNHTTFYGRYFLNAAKWAITSPITLSESAHIEALDMTVELGCTKALNALNNSRLKVNTLDGKNVAEMFGEYLGIFEAQKIQITNDGNTHKIGAGFRGVMCVKYVLCSKGQSNPTFYFNPSSESDIIVGDGGNFEVIRGYLRIGSENTGPLVLHSAGNWSFVMTDHRYTSSADNIQIVMQSDLAIDTSNYDKPTEEGFVVTLKNNAWKDTKYQKMLSGAKAFSVFGNGTFEFGSRDAQFTGGFTASNDVTVAVKKGVYPGKGNVTIKDTATLKLVDSDSGTVPVAGILTLEGGSILRIPQLGGVMPLSVSALQTGGDSEKKVHLSIGNAESLSDGVYIILASNESISDDVFEKLALKFGDDAVVPEYKLRRSLDGKSILLVWGNPPNTWIGGSEGNLSEAANWSSQMVPANGAGAVICCASAATLERGESFAPSSITFSAGCAAVTIDGEEAIKGIAAVTNLSSSVQEIACPLEFADNYRVHCSSKSVNFSGGATATYPASDMTDNAASRALTGNITFTEDWTAVTPMSNKYTVPNGSRVYGKALIGGVEDKTFLCVQNGGYAKFDSILTGKKLGRVSVQGELEVVNQWIAIATDNYSQIGEDSFSSETGVLRAGGLWKGDDTRDMSKILYIKIKELYIGKDGLGAKQNDYYLRFDHNDGHVIHATDDFEIFGPLRSDNPHDWGLHLNGKNITFDTAGHTVLWTAGAQGSNGKTVKTGEGTLVMNPHGTTLGCAWSVDEGTLALAKNNATGSGAITVNAGAVLEVRSSTNVALGGDLTLKNGACLGFNYTTRNPPVLNLTDRNVAFEEGESTSIVVKISSSNGKRAYGGVNVLTSGGNFSGVTVSKAADNPDWVKDIYVDDNGNIVLLAKPIGTRIIVR